MCFVFCCVFDWIDEEVGDEKAWEGQMLEGPAKVIQRKRSRSEQGTRGVLSATKIPHADMEEEPFFSL